MTREELDSIGTAFRNIGATFAERMRHEGQGAVPPFEFFTNSLRRESTRLSTNGAPDVAAAVLALGDRIDGADNA